MSKVNKGFNMATEELEVAIINVIKESGLPIAVSKMVVDRIAVKVTNQLAIEIEMEQKVYKEAIEAEQKEGKE